MTNRNVTPILVLLISLLMPCCGGGGGGTSLPPGWQKVIVDSEGDLGISCSMDLDSLGNPHISYYDATNQCLKYATTGPDGQWGTPDDIIALVVDPGPGVGLSEIPLQLCDLCV